MKMRLICLNCNAQYEVADDVIPQSGRDVQCSNCDHTWFESVDKPDIKHDFPNVSTDLPPGKIQEDPAPEVNVSTSKTEQEKLQRQELDPAVADILREEAAHEAAARRRETEAIIESQPNLGLNTARTVPDQRTQEVQRRMALLKRTEVAGTKAAAASRRELLPDIEEINSSLRSEAEREESHDAMKITKNKGRHSFWIGFFGVLFSFTMLIAIYIFAHQISETVPSIAQTLDSYVITVDSLRLWFDLKLQSLVKTMNAGA